MIARITRKLRRTDTPQPRTTTSDARPAPLNIQRSPRERMLQTVVGTKPVKIVVLMKEPLLFADGNGIVSQDIYRMPLGLRRMITFKRTIKGEDVITMLTAIRPVSKTHCVIVTTDLSGKPYTDTFNFGVSITLPGWYHRMLGTSVPA